MASGGSVGGDSIKVASPKWKTYMYKTGDRHCWRGIYNWDEEEDEQWKASLKDFPYKVPSFETEEEAMEFMLKWSRVGSNLDQRNYMHIFTLLTSWDQVDKKLLKMIDWYDQKYGNRSYEPIQDPSKNVWLRGPPEDDSELEVKKVVDALDRRLNIPFHKVLSAPSTLNTLKYLFEHMRAGIFVKIKANKLCMFVPFANAQYRNTWGNVLEFDSSDGTYDTYRTEKKAAGYRYENTMSDVGQWWANGNVIDNERVRAGTDRKFAQEWGDFFLCQLREMLEAACRTRQVADCEFFINKRDYPHLKVNHEQGKATEPYGFIFGKDDKDPDQDLPLSRHDYTSYAPIASFYISDRFADIPWPTTEDWEAATGRLYPTTFVHKYDHDGKIEFEGKIRTLFTEENFQRFGEIPWEEKVNTAFFRGTATGGGTKIENNQRLKLANLHHVWDQDDYLAGREEEDGVPLLDAKLVGWNMRDKKIASEPMTYIRKKDFPFNADRDKNFVPIYEQARYKYLIYVEGHCAACRYSFLMRLGSVILKVESQCVADQMWYFPLLRPYVDHVPVKADLSDLDEKIEWCRDNDDECRTIAANARRLYDTYCAKEGILDYLQIVTHKLSQNWRHVPDWWKRPSQQAMKPREVGGHTDCKCPRCLEEKKKEDIENDEKRRAAEARKRAANARWEERERKRKLARAAAGINAEAQEGGEDGVDEDAGDEHRD